jgi:hypothetical protein
MQKEIYRSERAPRQQYRMQKEIYRLEGAPKQQY